MIRYHLAECQHAPKPGDGEVFCCRCQTPKLQSENFSRRSAAYRGNYATACKQCSYESLKDWHEKRKTKGIPRNERVGHDQPSKWVFHPCPYCGQPFRHYDMLKHKPRCDQRPAIGSGRRPYALAVNTPSTPEEKLSLMERRSSKRNNLAYFYGITLEQFEAMIEAQNGACAICGRVPSGGDQRTGVLHVDHDHTTKAVRSLLCFTCNHGIGNFRDDPSLLTAAIDYLKYHSENPSAFKSLRRAPQLPFRKTLINRNRE